MQARRAGLWSPVAQARRPASRAPIAIAPKPASRAGTSKSRGSSKRLPEITGKPLVMNVSGAIARVMLDAGFPLLAVKGIPIPRAHCTPHRHRLEEQERPIGFILADSGLPASPTTGPRPPGSTRRMMFNAPLSRSPDRRTGHVHHRPVRRNDAGGSWRRRIKVESAEGDPYRAYQHGLYSPHFQAYNRNTSA